MGLGLVLGPLIAAQNFGLDLMWTGLIAGSLAYAVHRLREAKAKRAMSATMAESVPIWRSSWSASCRTRFWRVLGLVLVRGLDENSQVIVWVRAVATAMLAGVLAQLVLSSSGALAPSRSACASARPCIGFVAFLIARRSVFAGVVAGELR